MKENQFSLTAMMCAYLRACHAEYDGPKIFNDFLACHLVPDKNRALIEQGLLNYLQQKSPEIATSLPDQTTAIKQMARAMNSRSNLLSRSRYTEDSLEVAVNAGVQQYVILGAGFDTFAFRRKDMLNRLSVFEIDHPATQAFKKQRIAELGWVIPSQLSFIAVDFNQESLASALRESTFDPQCKSFFSWLGVTMYLDRSDVFSTLSSIAAIAPSGSTIVFDYFEADLFNPEQTEQYVKEEMAMAKQAGEPMKTGFDPSMLATDLANLGFYLHEDLSPIDIQKRYLQGRKYAHIAQAIVK